MRTRLGGCWGIKGREGSSGTRMTLGGTPVTWNLNLQALFTSLSCFLLSTRSTFSHDFLHMTRDTFIALHLPASTSGERLVFSSLIQIWKILEMTPVGLPWVSGLIRSNHRRCQTQVFDARTVRHRCGHGGSANGLVSGALS